MCCEQNVVELKVKAARQDCTSTESLIYVRMMREEVEERGSGETHHCGVMARERPEYGIMVLGALQRTRDVS